MNLLESDILKALLNNPAANQRMLTEMTGYSLGSVNKCIKSLKNQGFLDPEDGTPTTFARETALKSSPANAVILAAGFGMRMMPINHVKPKGLLEVKGEVLIERTIRQLREAGIKDISVVVGFMKEWYEYLHADYGVRLITNSDYSITNNLHSLIKAADFIGNTYIIPCDLWCRDNPYSHYELRSWYMVGEWQDFDSTIRANRRMELVNAAPGEGCAMIGICYVQGSDSAELKRKLLAFSRLKQYDKAYWEAAVSSPKGMRIPARIMPSGSVIEINTFEQLRELDKSSDQLRAPAISAICSALKTTPEEIINIKALKKGMTNRSFLFECGGVRYIMRIPGEGTDRLIDRMKEAEVYSSIKDRGICDDIVYIDPATGYKITRYIENARVCDPENRDDVRRCMKRLREFHELGLSVGHRFDIFGQIEFYESLREGDASAYRDYEATKESVLSLRNFIESCEVNTALTHIDAVPDNFLMYNDADGEERIVLIDWEYSAMQDPHVDIAMFCIYSMYDRSAVDSTIDAYFPEGTDERTQYKIYAYIAMCGLLWSNWCEYKMRCGVDFGEYSISQYEYARDYAKTVLGYLNRKEGLNHAQS